LRDAERKLGRAIAPRTTSERLEQARRALAEQRFDKVGDELAALATLDARNPDALALLDATLARANERAAQGATGDLAALARRLANTPWADKLPRATESQTPRWRSPRSLLALATLVAAFALVASGHGALRTHFAAAVAFAHLIAWGRELARAPSPMPSRAMRIAWALIALAWLGLALHAWH
jgi:hypothetical protein